MLDEGRADPDFIDHKEQLVGVFEDLEVSLYEGDALEDFYWLYQRLTL